MYMYVLSETAKVVVRSTFSGLHYNEGNIEDVKSKKEFFTKTLESNISNFRNAIINKDEKDVVLDTNGYWYKFCLDDDSIDVSVHEPADDKQLSRIYSVRKVSR